MKAISEPHLPETNVSIVVVTYNRQELLRALLASISAMEPHPTNVVIVDNASTDNTRSVIDSFINKNECLPIYYLKLDENTGGSGGFNIGIGKAMELDAEWLWVMDDDVEVIPDSLERMAKWQRKFLCFHGTRLNADGTTAPWQCLLSPGLAIAPLSGRDTLASQEYVLANSGCFEGMVLHRSIVEEIGLPDSRYFITWDDAIYGWEVSQHTPVAYVNDNFLKRGRELAQVEIAGRTIAARNDLGRYYVLRNRALVAQKMKQYGKHSGPLFAVGTTLTFLKEAAKTVLAEKYISGIRPLVRGAVANRKLRRSLRAEKPLNPD